MVRWLEANGYDVSYFSGVDSATRGQELLEHKAFLSVGHDEYWSNQMRTPVTIAANTTYVVSYFTNSGDYAVDRQYFATQYTNGPLLALASGASGGNGVYRYGATNGFPTKSYQASNYWVDVVFAAGTG